MSGIFLTETVPEDLNLNKKEITVVLIKVDMFYQTGKGRNRVFSEPSPSLFPLQLLETVPSLESRRPESKGDKQSTSFRGKVGLSEGKGGHCGFLQSLGRRKQRLCVSLYDVRK